MPYTIDGLRETISPIAAQHCVKSISPSGSYSTENVSADSDIDLKIEKAAASIPWQIIAEGTSRFSSK